MDNKLIAFREGQKKDKFKKMNLSFFVGDIDLTSNQMLKFLEFFIEEMSQKNNF